MTPTFQQLVSRRVLITWESVTTGAKREKMVSSVDHLLRSLEVLDEFGVMYVLQVSARQPDVVGVRNVVVELRQAVELLDGEIF